ncbi:PilZ domain-containing protein [Paraliobacillus sediminis]|uniref:PilZ domain-containing protein n=1 Tax=Paraliobacillus sediminis TaxID=1885916 RepID=UPI0013C2ED5D|nr:PilZ domain-containing protein [Paraliobacillus sediminis]
MQYKRETAFRYTFEEPISALFRIENINGNAVTTSAGEAKIIDISTEGIKLTSELNIPETDKSIHLVISFELNEQEMNFKGIIVWKKKNHAINDYGVNLMIEENAKKELIEQLKIYSKKVKGNIN